MDLGTVISIVSEYWPEVEAIYLFGSHAAGEAWPSSDLDLALLLPPAVARRERLIALHDARFELERASGGEVDLVNLREVPTVVQNEIIHHGRRIHEPDRYAAESFEMQVLSAYQKLNQERAGILEDGLRGGRFYNV